MKIAIPVFAGEVSSAINTAYLKYISAAGFEPITFSQFNNVEEIAKECNGLVLPGGIDVEPTFYGDNNLASHNCNPEKDNFERMALHTFIKENKNVFGICRGFQLIVREFMHEFHNFCEHLDFYQHVNDHALTNDRNAKRSTPTHGVHMNVASLYNSDNNKNVYTFVNSIHHQALVANNDKKLNVTVNKQNSLASIAVTNFGTPKIPVKSLIIEAVDILFDGVKLRGVQWHPEELMDVGLLTFFFNEENNGQHQKKNKYAGKT